MRKTFIAISLLGLISCAGGDQKSPESLQQESRGRNVYSSKCTACHGNDGSKGLAGAKDLSTSKLTDEEMIEIVKSGKGTMAGYGAILSEAEVNQVVEYIKTLRK